MSDRRRSTFGWTTATAGDVRLETRAAPGTLASRYELLERIGEGGEGEVWRARDQLADEIVAVKLLAVRPDVDLVRARREVTALRWLRSPGVVPLRDDGIEGNRYFLVMDLVEGRPFPGGATPMCWEALAPLAVALLEVLARVHHAGVVHRDLKPSNVLVRLDGRPVVLDFGVATGRSLAPDLHALGLTALYAAPEQLLAQPCDARADLYAVGVMLYEALVGHPPHGTSRDDAIRRRLAGERPRLSHLVPALPAPIAAAIEQMMCFDPADRPASAVEAVALLGGDAVAVVEGRGLDLPARVASPEGLRPLFRGPDAFLHLAEDAATALYERTGGEAGRVRQELAAWVRAGLAWWDGGLLVVERQAIDRLAAGLPLVLGGPDRELSGEERELLDAVRLAFPEARASWLAERLGWTAARVGQVLGSLQARDRVWPLPDHRLGAQPQVGAAGEAALLRVEAGPEARLVRLAEQDPVELLLAIARAAEAQIAAGRLPRAAAVLEHGLLLARQSPALTAQLAECEAELLRLYCIASVAGESVAAFERALYALERAVVTGDDIDAWIWLLHGMRAAWWRQPERALTLLDALPVLPDEDLETWRQAARVRAAAVLGPAEEERILAELGPWSAGSRLRAARLQGWLGNARYRQHRFAESQDLHIRSARGKERPDARLASLVNAAMAAMEHLDFAEAGALADEAITLAVALRHPAHEAVGRWVQRQSAYRAGLTLTPCPELPQAAAGLGAWYEAVHALSEAAIAWRGGELALALSLARRGARCFTQTRQTDLVRLLTALEWVIVGDAPRAALDTLADPSVGGDLPGVVVQTLGLLHLATATPDPTWAPRARTLAACRPPEAWAARLEILSIDEALAMAEGRWTPGPAVWRKSVE